MGPLAALEYVLGIYVLTLVVSLFVALVITVIRRLTQERAVTSSESGKKAKTEDVGA